MHYSLISCHVKHGSTINLHFLNTSKAFNTGNHFALYGKLIHKSLLLSKCTQTCAVNTSQLRWNDVLSIFLMLRLVFIRVGYYLYYYLQSM